MVSSVRFRYAALFLLAALCLWAPSASAQVEVRLGVKEGGYFGTLVGGDRQQVGAPTLSPRLGRRPGLIIGGVVALVPRGPFGLRTEVLWIWKGAKGKEGNVTTTTKLNYAEVPVLATYRSPVSVGPLRPEAIAGLTVGLKTAAVREQITNVASGPTRLTGRTDLSTAARDLDLGVAVGGAVEYPFSDWATLRAEVRYRRSLTRALTGSAGTGPAAPPDVWNQGVAVTLSFVYATGWFF